MKNSFLIRDGDSLEFIIFDDGIIFSLLLLSCSLQQQQQQLANLSVAQKEEEKRGEERRGQHRPDLVAPSFSSFCVAKFFGVSAPLVSCVSLLFSISLPLWLLGDG